ncbi:enoyl-CoA hydratase/isomerase family protein [Sphingomonas histidinilytica]|uniref:enoyl-CoA hydratase/isomerase family protein n=1 Tax=Rhizorhabdus histidinilytica TaxID=439228 RepID=UPI001ADA0D11|nr:enoyl-CoA hydratase/isomerase family protein [Rhizorhabdus histidinilytica]MBO9378815.1 enoyl-CoA hydratase/isomerase family protein [Rhizorhabdus histidinilytica]
MTIDAQEPVLVLRDGTLGRIRLNRPKALNSLTLEMVRTMAAALKDFAEDDSVGAVLVDGLGERGLSAGGDIRALYNSAKALDGVAATFFDEEYAMNAFIASFPKPYVAFMDGITMGGGVGISAHGSHRVVTERTRLAMPETGIGFLPDVGGTWLLAHLPGEVGTYIGLTGASISGADAVDIGLADILVQSDGLATIADTLSAVEPGVTNDDISALLGGFAEKPQSALAPNRRVIDRVFAFDEVGEILSSLEADGSDFAHETLKVIAHKSPSALVLTLQLLRLGRRSESLRECLDREYATATQMILAHDFQEGVRAAVIDKDRHPKWQPSTVAEVDAPDLLLEYGLSVTA